MDLLGVATICLALATVWMALEVRQGRIESGKATTRVALRGALMEQMENARRVYALDPARLAAEFPARARKAEPDWGQVQSLLRSLDLPPELAAYLMWLAGDTRRVWDQIARKLDAYVFPNGIPDRLYADWWLLLDRVQVAAALAAAELTRRGCRVDGASVDGVTWMLPKVAPGGRASTQLTEETYLLAPRFPADKAYAGASPAARDAHAQRILAATQEKLASASEAARPR